MNLQNELFAILSQYPFVHLDRVGRFSILVPLTGARTVCERFYANSNNPVSLYLFGDNTCQSDIERRSFFEANNFEPRCNELISKLTHLAHRFSARPDDYEVIQKLIKQLQSDKVKALAFQQGNPELEQMTNDLRAEGQIIISKGEFIVTGQPDGARYLDLPNIMAIVNSATGSRKQLLDSNKANDYLTNLIRIAKPESENGLITAITLVARQENIHQRLNQSRESVFRAIYEQLRGCYPSLKELDQATLSTYVEQFSHLVDENENFTTWTEKEIIDNIALVFNEAKLIDEVQIPSLNRFAEIYHHALAELSKTNHDAIKANTYKLFIIQSFLYLCALQIRLKNPVRANAFLVNVSSTVRMSQIIIDLCSNETALMTRLNNEYGITPKEYAVLLSSCHQIALDHLDIPHYDELRTACMPLNIENTQYLVIGGRLCWSTSLISDYGNVNSPRMQKENFAARFRTLFTTKPTASEIREAFLLLNDTLSGSELVYEEISLASLEAYIDFFSEQQCLELLNTALEQKKYTCANLLLVMGADDKQLFLRYFNESFNQVVVECFLDANSSYSDYISKDDLVEAHRNGLNDKVSVILKYKPEFSTLGKLCYQHESQLKPQFDHLLDFWKNKANSFSRLNHHSASLAATALFEQLTAAGNRFFSCRLSQQSMDTFEKECKSAFDDAKPVMDSHRGWHGLPLFLRAVLGFIAAITIVPAVIVALATPKGYAGTFFKCSETDSAQRLTEMQGDVDRLCRSLT